jgi:hypothetical protein
MDRDRISLFIHRDEVCFRVIDSSGTRYMNKVSMADAHIEYGRPVYLMLELGLARDYVSRQVENEGRHASGVL